MNQKLRLIDEIFTEIFDKDILGEIVCISVSRDALNELKSDYSEEFKAELLESGRSVSESDIKDHFGKSLLVQEQPDGKKYSLLRQV